MQAHSDSLTRRGSCQRSVNLRAIAVVLAIGMLAIVAPEGIAQTASYAQQGEPEDEGIALLQAIPHDIVRFVDSAGGGWAKVNLLPLPGRKVPPMPKGDLALEVLSLPGQQFAAKWSDIKSIDLWEERLERETADRMKSGDFQGAYPYLAILIRDFPARPNLRTLRSEFLLKNAAKRFTGGELDATLAMLEELRRFNPTYKPDIVLKVISQVTDSMMKALIDANKHDDAQMVLARLQRDYPNNEIESIKTWDSKFLEMSKEKRKEAIAAKDKQDWRPARRLALASLYLYPKIPGGKELLREIDVAYPLVRVGVMQSATDLDPTRIDNWASRRAGRLVYRTLFEMRGTGPEGGEYDFILGDAEQSPDRLQFDLTLSQQKMRPPLDKVSSQMIADLIASRSLTASETYSAPWTAAVDYVSWKKTFATHSTRIKWSQACRPFFVPPCRHYKFNLTAG